MANETENRRRNRHHRSGLTIAEEDGAMVTSRLKNRTPYKRRQPQTALTRKQRENLAAIVAAGGREKWVGMYDIQLQLKRVGLKERANSTLYVSLRQLKAKLERIEYRERLLTKKYWGYRVVKPGFENYGGIDSAEAERRTD